MGNAANFTVIRDNWTDLLEGANFDVQSTVDTARHTVLTFMLNNASSADVGVVIKINGRQVWHWNYSSKKVQMYQEVIGEDVIHAGTNTIKCEVTLKEHGGLDFSAIALSDIVLWYRVNV